MNELKEKIEWKISVPIFGVPLILKQLGIAIGIPFGIVAIIIAVSSGKSIYTLYALGLIAAVLFLTWLFVMVIYRGKYDAEFVLDDKIVICRTQTNQAKKNRVVNSLTVLLGLFSGQPTVAGAGALAQSRQEVNLRWINIRKVKYKPKNNMILLWGGFAEQIALFCTPENYTAVEQAVQIKTAHLKKAEGST